MRRLLLIFSLIALSLSAPFALQAQDSTSITGVVTDASGATVRGASVTLVDTSTNTIYRAKTSSTGGYTIAGVRPAPSYKITFEAPGFQGVVIQDFALQVGLPRTQNATLKVGETTTVEVDTSNKVVINTTDATVGNNLDVNDLEDLPVQARDSASILFRLQPGYANGSITGARTDQSSVTIDGLDANDIAAGTTFGIIPTQPLDSYEEFRGSVAGLNSNIGTGSGGQYQLVTKNGTNKFHGNLNEYNRNTNFAANTWFGNNSGLARTPLIRNQFGGNIGGPVLHDKLFFFFNFYESRIKQSTLVTRTVPLDDFRNGTINYILNKDASGTTCTAASRLNTTPQCIGNLSSAGVAALDPAGIGFDQTLLAFINKRYPHANDLTGGNGINTGSYRFNTPTPDNESNYVLRMDYNLNNTMKIFGRTTIQRRDATQSTIEFQGDPVTHPFVDRSYSYVFGHIWSIGSNKVNQVSYGDTISKFDFPTSYDPTGTSQYSFSLLDGPYSGLSSQKRRVPIPVVRDDFNWQKGSHNFGFGGTFKFIKTNSALVNDFNFVGIGLGGNVNTLNSDVRPKGIRTAGTTSASVYDNAFALALGRVASIGSNYNYSNSGSTLPQGGGAVRRYRYFQTELYAGDAWKLTKNLTVSYGLRYQLYSTPYEANGSESIQNFSFDNYVKARVAQSGAGLSGDTTVPFITYKLGGKANNADPIYHPSYKDIAPRVAFAYNPSTFQKLVINGGIGLVYDRTVINAINFIQDQSSYLFQNSANTPYGTAGDPVGSLSTDPRVGDNLSYPAPPTAPAIAKPFTPFVSDGTPFGLANNQFNTIIDPNLKTPYSIAFNAGIQQELPENMVLKISYVGRLGRRLLGQADASQLIDFKDSVSGQLMSTAIGNVTQKLRADGSEDNILSLAPEPWLENVVAPGLGVAYGYGNNTQLLADNFSSLIKNGDMADFVQALAAGGYINSNVGMASQFAENTFVTNKGFSSYNGLLLTVQKDWSHGLKFNVNYSWSHSIDNTSLVANSIAAGSGIGFICDVIRPKECRGNSDFDSTQVFNADFIYKLPVGRGKAIAGGSSRLLDELIGGWQISGIPTYATGFAYTAVSNAYVAGYANNAPATFIGNRGDLKASVHKNPDGSVNIYKNGPTVATSDFVGPVGFQIGSRNNLRGPNTFLLDAGLAKRFPLVEDRLVAKFSADAFNVLNHPTFSTGVNDITSGSFGQITATSNSPRVLQLGLRIEF